QIQEALQHKKLDKASKKHLMNDLRTAKENRVPVELVVTTCPPYSVDDEGKFLFNGSMQYDAGIVARKTLEYLDDFFRACQHHSVPVKVTFAYADHEGDDPDIRGILNDDSKNNYAKYIQYAMQHIAYVA